MAEHKVLRSSKGLNLTRWSGWVDPIVRAAANVRRTSRNPMRLLLITFAMADGSEITKVHRAVSPSIRAVIM